MTRELRALEQSTRDLAGEWLRRCNGRGVAVVVYCTTRTLEDQAAEYIKGRERNAAGVWVRTGGPITTHARPGSSWHNHARALDAAPWEFYVAQGTPSVERKLDWTPFRAELAGAADAWGLSLHPPPVGRGPRGDLSLLDPRWRIMVEEADALGLEWAGRWTGFREFVHFQNRGGLDLDQLAAAQGITAARVDQLLGAALEARA